MRYCSFCGRQIEDEFFVCPYCGKGAGGMNSPGSPAEKYNYDADIGTTELILGIVSLCVSVILAIFSIASLVLSIITLVKVSKARKQGYNNNKLTGGMVCAIIGLCISGLYTLIFASVILLPVFGFLGFLGLLV